MSVEHDAVELELTASTSTSTSAHTPDALRENLKSLAAGGVGGVCAVLTGHPFDLIKVRCQSHQASGTFDAIRRILHEARAAPGSAPAALNAVRGFYRGVIPPLLGVTPIFAVSFWGYDVGKKLVTWRGGTSDVSSPSALEATVPASERKLTTAQMAAAGFFSAIPTTLVTAPTERVKVVLQTTRDGTVARAARQILADGGVRSFFKGSLATLARDGPGSALYFASYEVSKEYLQRGRAADELSIGSVCIAGGVAGVSMWLGVFPIDTIKTRLQAGSGSESMLAATRAIYRARGVGGFFPGLGPALLRSFPANAATFLGVELTHAAFRKYGV